MATLSGRADPKLQANAEGSGQAEEFVW